MKNGSIHPIDQRLKELGKTRKWLAKQIGKTPQCIGLYCNHKKLIVPESGFANLISGVLGVDINYLVMGRSTSAQAQGELKLKIVRKGE